MVLPVDFSMCDGIGQLLNTFEKINKTLSAGEVKGKLSPNNIPSINPFYVPLSKDIIKQTNLYDNESNMIRMNADAITLTKLQTTTIFFQKLIERNPNKSIRVLIYHNYSDATNIIKEAQN